MIARLRARLAHSARVVRAVATRSVSEFLNNRGTILAASISYYALLSVFPLAIFLVAISGLVLRDDELRERATEEIVKLLSLDQGGAEEVADTLDGVAGNQSVIGFVGLVFLVWTASALMGAVRNAFATIWGVKRRGYVRAKALDILLVLSVGVLVSLSLGLTIAVQGVTRVSDEAADAIGPLGASADLAGWLAGTLAPIVITFVVFLFAYRVIPAVRPPYRDIWPGALLGALVFEVLKVGFAFYVANFASYNVVYGSLGAVIAFMVFVYLSAIVLLFGAEVISELGIARGEAHMPPPPSEHVPFKTKVVNGLRALVAHPLSHRPRRKDEDAESRSADAPGPTD